MAEKLSVEDQIKHFLRLAEDKGATQSERDVASGRAERLMTKHLIDRLSLDLDSGVHAPKEEIVSEFIWIKGGGGSYALDLVMGMIPVAQAMQCHAYYYDNRANKVWRKEKNTWEHGISLRILGYQSDVSAAVQLINSLLMQGPIAVRAYQRGAEWAGLTRFSDKAGKWRVTLGFLQAFGYGAAERIRETRKSVLNEYDDRTALVLVDRSKDVNDYVSENLNVKTKTDRRQMSYAAAHAGREAGRSAAGVNQQSQLSGRRAVSA